MCFNYYKCESIPMYSIACAMFGYPNMVTSNKHNNKVLLCQGLISGLHHTGTANEAFQ